MSQNQLNKIRNVDVTKIDIDRIIYLTANLINALNKETEILDKMDITEYGKIFDFKVKIIDELDIHQKIIEKKPELLKSVDKSKLEDLKSLKEPLDQAKIKNKKRLEAAISVNKQVVEVVNKMMAEKIENRSGYSKSGTYAASSDLEGRVPAMSYNSKT